MNLPTQETEPPLCGAMNQDDLDMLRLIDSFSDSSQRRRLTALEQCGVEPERLTLYNLGAASLTGAERELVNGALFA